jgi:hypothetical protein
VIRVPSGRESVEAPRTTILVAFDDTKIIVKILYSLGKRFDFRFLNPDHWLIVIGEDVSSLWNISNCEHSNAVNRRRFKAGIDATPGASDSTTLLDPLGKPLERISAQSLRIVEAVVG